MAFNQVDDGQTPYGRKAAGSKDNGRDRFIIVFILCLLNLLQATLTDPSAGVKFAGKPEFQALSHSGRGPSSMSRLRNSRQPA